jgi:uncharacterized protein YciI
MTRLIAWAAAAAVTLLAAPSAAQTPSASAAKTGYDAALAQSVGADDYGMRQYVLVILKSGPTRVPAGAERDAMFKGHMANIDRLSKEGKLALAGPFAGEESWRGLFILAVTDLEEAKRLVASDPVIAKGEMVAEYHTYYGSAALMLVGRTHDTIAKKRF